MGPWTSEEDCDLEDRFSGLFNAAIHRWVCPNTVIKWLNDLVPFTWRERLLVFAVA